MDTILTFLGTAKYWLIAIAISTTLAFGGGYWLGEQSVVKVYAQATVNAAPVAAAAQSAKDGKDAKANQADSQARQGQDRKRDVAVEAIKKTEFVLLPATPCPTISPEAMGKLNDPDIIGAQ